MRRGPDLSRIDPEDSRVYDLIGTGRCKGVFLLQSPAQFKMGQCLRSRHLPDLAFQVALIRPGVGFQGSAVSDFVSRYRQGAAWDYDHSLERRALERSCGIIVWQERVVQLLMDVAGLRAAGVFLNQETCVTYGVSSRGSGRRATCEACRYPTPPRSKSGWGATISIVFQSLEASIFPA